MNNFIPTYPPQTYPSTSPYAELTSYFRELVKSGVITRFIVKALLYPEFLREIDISQVKVRRKHKRTLRLKKRESWFVASSTEESDENEDQDAEGSKLFFKSSEDEARPFLTNTDSGSTDTNPFGLIQYYTGKKSQCSEDLTLYESFIDHGENTEEIDEVILAPDCDNLKTSKSRQKLSTLEQQISDAQSSFEGRLHGCHMAFEDLVNADDNLEMNCLNKPKTVIEERHSMPMYFVGNRFNVSSLTEIYIPSWKDKQEAKKSPPSKDSINLIEHSNLSQEIPVESEIFAPPEMFQNTSAAVSIIREATPFNKHFINSDKVIRQSQLSAKSYRISIKSLSPEKPIVEESPLCDSLDVAQSTQAAEQSNESDPVREPVDDEPAATFVRPASPWPSLHLDDVFSKRNNLSREQAKKCSCCPGSVCYSPRSSDSGMAGSVSISSPDPPLCEFDTKLTHSSHVNHTIDCFKPNKHMDYNNKKDNNSDSGQYENSLKNFKLKDFDSNEIEGAATEAPSHAEIVINICDGEKEEEGNEGGVKIYQTNLYAHWWKKETIEISTLDFSPAPSSVESYVYHPGTRSSKGSGKRPCCVSDDLLISHIYLFIDAFC